MNPRLKRWLLLHQLSGGGGVVPPASLLDGVMEHYALDEASAGDARVGSVAGYDLADVNSGLIGVAGKVGARSILFKTNHYLRRQTTDLRIPATGFTILAWLFLEDHGNGDLIARWTGGAEYLLNYAEIASEKTFHWRINFSGGVKQVSASGYPYALQQWHLVACRYDPDADVITISVDNETPASTSTAGAGTLPSTSGEITFGWITLAYPNNHRMDDVRFWNRPLTDDELTAYWNDGHGLETLTAYPDRSLNWICEGDSLTADYTNIISAERWPDQASVLLGGGKYNDPTNIAVSGRTIATMLSNAATNAATYHISGKTNVVSIWGGTNDLAAAAAVATVQSDYQDTCEAWRAGGFLVNAFTVLPRDAADQSGFDTARATFNTWLRANWTSFADVLVDVAADTSIGDNGDELDTTYYHSDQVHLNAAGRGIVAGLAAAAINSIT